MSRTTLRTTTAIRSAAVRAAVAMLCVAGLLAGCASTPDVQETTAGELQSAVTDVANAAAAADYSRALEKLGVVQARLDTAAAAGDVSAGRAARIQSSIDVVRADLTKLLTAPTPTATPTPTQTAAPTPTKKPGNGKDKGKP